jgi:hypothetical protein
MVEHHISSTEIPSGIRHVKKSNHKYMKAVLLSDDPTDNATAIEIQEPTSPQRNDVLTFDTIKHHSPKPVWSHQNRENPPHPFSQQRTEIPPCAIIGIMQELRSIRNRAATYITLDAAFQRVLQQRHHCCFSPFLQLFIHRICEFENCFVFAHYICASALLHRYACLDPHGDEAE